MSKRLWVVRHANAVEHSPHGGRDRDRRLSAKGEHDVEALRRDIAAGNVASPTPELVVASAAVRTMATATGAFDPSGTAGIVSADRRLYRATPDDVLDIVHELPDDIAVAGIVGHNPTIHCLSIDLVDEMAVHGATVGQRCFAPGTVAVFVLPIDRWSDASFGSATIETVRIPAAR